MPNLFASLRAAGNALEAFERSMSVSQNNVNNASTPGFARQDFSLSAMSFDEVGGLLGGVHFDGTLNGRNEFAEQAVRDQVEAWGRSSQQLSSLKGIESLFDLNGNSGISSAMNQLFQSFSAWSADPSGTSARQGVLTGANNLAIAFRQAASQLASVTRTVDGDISSTVNEINRLAGQIRGFNSAKQGNAAPDPGLEAGLHNSLEQLAELVDFVPVFQDNGTVTVLVGGQTPIVIGDHFMPLSLGTESVESPLFENATPGATILDSNGLDITANLTGGRLTGLLSVRNQTIAGLQGSPTQIGSLNQLAKSIADRVNQILTSATGGTALFTYDAVNGTSTASSLAVIGSVQPGDMVASDGSEPNGIALQLAGLRNSSSAADQINGQTYLDFFGSIVTGIGQQVANAKNSSDSGALTLAQARTFRSEETGVSLDEEALRLLELQRAYQANAHMVSIISELSQTVIEMMR